MKRGRLLAAVQHSRRCPFVNLISKLRLDVEHPIQLQFNKRFKAPAGRRHELIDPMMDGNSETDSAKGDQQDSSKLNAGNGTGFNNPQSAPAWQRASTGTPINTGVHGAPGHHAHVSAVAGANPRSF